MLPKERKQVITMCLPSNWSSLNSMLDTDNAGNPKSFNIGGPNSLPKVRPPGALRPVLFLGQLTSGQGQVHRPRPGVSSCGRREGLAWSKAVEALIQALEPSHELVQCL